MVKLGEFLLEDRAARFEPTVDLREGIAERETFQPFREADQNAHDDTASLRAGSRLAGSCHFAGHRFGAGLPLATVVASPRKRWEFGARRRPFRLESPPKAESRKTYEDSDTANAACVPPGRVGVTAVAQSEIGVVIWVVSEKV